jgi:hypothetical protein
MPHLGQHGGAGTRSYAISRSDAQAIGERARDGFPFVRSERRFRGAAR